MKINPLGINSYQQVTGRDLNRQQALEPQTEKKTAEPKISIPTTEEVQSSRLAVKVDSGTYADSLSAEERNALDLLFSRYADRSRFGRAYNNDVNSDRDDAHLGNHVDLKV